MSAPITLEGDAGTRPPAEDRGMLHAFTLKRQPIGRIDILFTLLIAGVGVPAMVENLSAPVNAPVIALPFYLVTLVPLLWRRAAPLGAMAILGVATATHVAIFGHETRCGPTFAALLLLAFAAAVRLDRLEGLLALGLSWLTMVVMLAYDHNAGLDALPLFVPLSGIVWFGGRLVRSRGSLAEELDARNTELREVRDERARLEILADRSRLSVELDDLLRRRLAELAQLADAGAADHGDATAALATIERESRSTLEQMRAVVGVLRHDEDGSPTAPQPTLTHIEGLLVNAKGAGARLSVDGSPRALPAGVELSAYRVVEHLLDALDDEPDVQVCVRFADAGLELEVSGPARRRADADRAFERARERVALHHGTLEATLRAGRADAVALLPVAAG